MSRLRSTVTFILLTPIMVVSLLVAPVDAQETGNLSEKQVEEILNLSLKDLIEKLDEGWELYNRQLQAVVKTRLIAEKEFVSRVVLLVQEEEIPKNLVDSAWIWVRDRRPGTQYPFVYFERILRLQADKAKIAIPPFDRNIYSGTRSRDRFVDEQARRLNRRRR